MAPTSMYDAAALKILSPLSITACGMLVCASLSEAALAEPFKVAFVGDQGIHTGAQQVLELIRDEGTDLLVLLGDLGYEADAADAWINNMDTILGRDFPVLMVVGNHEDYEWPKYLQWQKDKLNRVDSIRCEGDVSVKAYCTYKDIAVVQVAPGIHSVEGINGSDNYAEYITEKFEADESTWRICSWHMNMHDMQTGKKRDATGWGVYQNCLAQGALVMTGHEHAYSRTHLMSDFEAKTIIHKNNEMEIGPYSTLAIVSGLGGREPRAQLHDGEWFASIYTADQNANHGALFCNFDNVRADCYMKDVAGLVPDAFSLTSTRAQDPVEVQPIAETSVDVQPITEPAVINNERPEEEADSLQADTLQEPQEAEAPTEALIEIATVEQVEQVEHAIGEPENTQQALVEASEPPTQDTQLSSQDAQSPTQDTQPPTQDAQPPTQDTQPPTQDTQSPTQDTQPPTQDSQPSTQDAQPPTQDSQPSTQDAQPPTQNSQPSTQDTQAPTQDAQTSTQDAQPPSQDAQTSTQDTLVDAGQSEQNDAQPIVSTEYVLADNASSQSPSPLINIPTATIEGEQGLPNDDEPINSLIAVANSSVDSVTSANSTSANRGGGFIHWLTLLFLLTSAAIRRHKATGR